MSKVSLCPHENINWSGGSRLPDHIGDGLYVKDLTSPLNFPPSVLMKKWTFLEIQRGMYPTAIKLEKYFFFILIAQAYYCFQLYCNFISNFSVYPIFLYKRVNPLKPQLLWK